MIPLDMAQHPHALNPYGQRYAVTLTRFAPRSHPVASRPRSELKIHRDGIVRFVLANRSMSSDQSGEVEISRALIEACLVDCMVALPGQLYYGAQVPACLWFLTKIRAADAKRGFEICSVKYHIAIAA